MSVSAEAKPQSTAEASCPQTGEEYLQSITDDGREVWIDGEKVNDVTTHKAFRNSTRMVARLYDAMHDEKNAKVLRAPMHDGSGWTHPGFLAPRNLDEAIQQTEAYAAWARIGYGWLGRSPDFIGAAFAPSFDIESEYFGEYAGNSKAYARQLQKNVSYIGHAIVNPPIDRGSPETASDIIIRVEKETDAGLIVSGAKVVATGMAIAQEVLIAHHFIPVADKKFAPIFSIDINSPGVKLFCRRSYEGAATSSARPYDAPLSSRLDENDSILVLDKVLVPWERVLMYDAEMANTFMAVPGQAARGLLQAGVRLAVKMDFICGLFMKAIEVGGTSDFRGVQAGVGEAIAFRHMLWALMQAMTRDTAPWRDNYVQPNAVHGHAYRVMAGDQYSKVRTNILKHVASGLIYLPSSADDYLNEDIKPYLDQYARGSNGIDSEERSKILKLLWDAVGSEFGSRHELYELNYSGSQEQVRVDQYKRSFTNGTAEQMLGLANKCMAEYDLNGWTVPDLFNPED